jgi:primary-amine oxidase
MFHTMRLFSLTLAVVELTRLATAQAHSCTANQPTVSAPHGNPWKALSEEETAGVSNLLLRRLNVTGTQGSR